MASRSAHAAAAAVRRGLLQRSTFAGTRSRIGSQQRAAHTFTPSPSYASMTRTAAVTAVSAAAAVCGVVFGGSVIALVVSPDRSTAEAQKISPAALEAVFRSLEKSSQIEVLEKYLKDGGNIDAVDERGRSLLMASIFLYNKVAFQLLLDHGANIQYVNKDGHTALEYAAWRGRLSMVRALLQRGAKADTVDMFGLTPLHKACGYGHTDVVRELVERGRLDVNARTRKPTAPAEYGAGDASADETCLHIAARHGSAEMVQTLLQLGADINARNVAGDTPLHEACRCQHGEYPTSTLEAIEALCAGKPDLSARNAAGKQPGDLASVPVRLALAAHAVPAVVFAKRLWGYVWR
eukprot:m.96717 g.96717  ORF g.96717 m.96717 type:complete len:351 (+) comp15497_c0_seq1:1022-2074(+)